MALIALEFLSFTSLFYGFLVLLAFWVFKNVQQWKQEEENFKAVPRVPSRIPIIGHLVSILTAGAVWDVFADWILTYGNTLRFPLWNETVILTADLPFIKRMMVHEYYNYGKHMPTFGPFLTLLGNGLVTSHGDLWKKQRKIIGIGFVGDMLNLAMDRGFEASGRVLDRMEEHRKKDLPIELDEELRRMAIQVIGEAILSMDPALCDKVFPDLYLPIVEEANRQTWWPMRKYLPFPGSLKSKSCQRKLNAYVKNLIRDRAQERALNNYQPTKNDVLDTILNGCELGPDSPLSAEQENQLCDEIKTFLLAGHETTASTLTWSLYELIQHPEALARVRQEADIMFPPNCDHVDRQLFKKTPQFTEAVIRETLRLYSPVPMVTRSPFEDDEFDGMKIPRGTWVSVMIRAVHLRPDLWPNPTVWRPERFLPGGDANMNAFMPFTQGPRRCMGQFFSITESKVVLMRLVQKFDFLPVKGFTVQRHRYVVPVCPSEPLMVRMTLRK